MNDTMIVVLRQFYNDITGYSETSAERMNSSC